MWVDSHVLCAAKGWCSTASVAFTGLTGKVSRGGSGYGQDRQLP